MGDRRRFAKGSAGFLALSAKYSSCLLLFDAQLCIAISLVGKVVLRIDVVVQLDRLEEEGQHSHESGDAGENEEENSKSVDENALNLEAKIRVRSVLESSAVCGRDGPRGDAHRSHWASRMEERLFVVLKRRKEGVGQARSEPALHDRDRDAQTCERVNDASNQ